MSLDAAVPQDLSSLRVFMEIQKPIVSKEREYFKFSADLMDISGSRDHGQYCLAMWLGKILGWLCFTCFRLVNYHFQDKFCYIAPKLHRA